MKTYDIIIVGAGPAGLRCAEILSNSSHKVLLLEKNSEIGPKVCAGGLTGKGMDYLCLPDELIEFKFDKIKLQVNCLPSIIKNHKTFAYTIDRKEFGQWQLSKLKKSPNVEIKTNAKVSAITPEYITVNDEKIAYKILVGADGSNSTVRRYLGLKTEKVVAAIQYIIPTDRFKNFELYFQPRKFHAGYVWIFPHKNYVSVGTGCDGKLFSTSKLKENFHRWLKNHKIDVTNAKYEAFPINADYQGYKFNNIYLLGDAAGLASGFTGEGIYQALISGEEIGKQILNPEYTPDLSRLLRNQQYHERLYALSNKWGKARVMLYYAGMFLLKYSPKWRAKFIDIVG
ncbi:MAG: NAD(P)/FAD-dependent oxidoreductase [Paludibacteraceae bacterium]